ncbi:MAG: hypothetical protein P1U56_08465 [Saprospiraceae bacterium]|nr:hypothetical protein [Saprospiraceae bacterium]
MKYLSLLVALILVTSCAPRMYYLGDDYPPTSSVDVYYDDGDISKEYRVIGQLTGNNESGLSSLDDIKESMIAEAKKRGADGILFLFADSFDDNHSVKASLLIYTQ